MVSENGETIGVRGRRGITLNWRIPWLSSWTTRSEGRFEATRGAMQVRRVAMSGDSLEQGGERRLRVRDPSARGVEALPRHLCSAVDVDIGARIQHRAGVDSVGRVGVERRAIADELGLLLRQASSSLLHAPPYGPPRSAGKEAVLFRFALRVSGAELYCRLFGRLLRGARPMILANRVHPGPSRSARLLRPVD